MSDFDHSTQENQNQRLIFGSMSSGIVATVIVSILGAISIRVIATKLGAGAYGIFVLAQSYVVMIQTFTDLGLAPVLQRDISRGDRDEKSLLSHAMGLRLTLSILVVPLGAALGLLVYQHRSNDLKVGLVLFLCSIPFVVSQEVSSAYFSARLRITLLSVQTILQQIVFVGLVVLAVSLHKSIDYCIGAALISFILSSIYTNYLARREVPFVPKFDRAVWSSMLRASTPVGLAYVIGMLYFKADTLILSFLSTTKQIGYYGAAYAIISVFLVFPAQFTRTFLPSMVRATKDDLEGSIRTALAYFSIGGAFGATAIMVCGPTVIRIVMGSHFSASNAPLRILGLGLVFNFVSTALSSVCVARGSGNKIFVMSVVSLILNVALNVVAIPKYGIKGASVATLVCEAISIVLFARLVHKDFEVRTNILRSLARPTAAGLITCAALAPFYLRSSLSVPHGLLLIPATCVLFFAALTILGGLPKDLVRWLRFQARVRRA